MISRSLPTLGFFDMKHTVYLLLLKSQLPLMSRAIKEQRTKHIVILFLALNSSLRQRRKRMKGRVFFLGSQTRIT